MSTTQSWSGLPDHYKRQAAPEMLAGVKNWQFYGCVVERPDDDTLRRWAGLAPQSPQAGAESITSIRTAEPNISQQKSEPMTRQQKRDAVDQALSSFVKVPDRELARKLGVSHTFIALRRRKAGNIAGSK